MRRTFRQLAAVKPSRFLEPGTPTGLTGLYTHAAPRSTLLYLYSSTLDKLKEIPESSLYRQSTEALTKHRMSIVSAVEPEGYKEWSEKAKKVIAEHPEVFNTPEGGVDHDMGRHLKILRDGKVFVRSKVDQEVDDTTEEWDGEENLGPELEGTRSTEDRKGQSILGLKRPGEDTKTVVWEEEPPLTAEQISDLETKIGAGLIEEVIQVAEGELKLVDTMVKAKVWEDLEEKPVEGQWTYFMRDTGTPVTQPPPQK
ncbi:NADH-ubiquinone oxidoreductase-like protein 299 kDa subunit [Stipitochalara longipes BDJ]|nr:NADH-ubiquinone oxidoreductase-like protein 299 kDa subunit [Stipitochalara longipes BDJ]